MFVGVLVGACVNVAVAVAAPPKVNGSLGSNVGNEVAVTVLVSVGSRDAGFVVMITSTSWEGGSSTGIVQARMPSNNAQTAVKTEICLGFIEYS